MEGLEGRRPATSIVVLAIAMAGPRFDRRARRCRAIGAGEPCFGGKARPQASFFDSLSGQLPLVAARSL